MAGLVACFSGKAVREREKTRLALHLKSLAPKNPRNEAGSGVVMQTNVAPRSEQM